MANQVFLDSGTPQLFSINSLTIFKNHQPYNLYLADASLGVPGLVNAQLAKQLSKQFDKDENLREVQFKAISKDGTEVGKFDFNICELKTFLGSLFPYIS